MRPRYLLAGLVCGGCLLFGGLSSSQELKRRPRPVVEDDTDGAGAKRGPVRIDKPATLERRVQDLETQMRSLTRELDALRRELRPGNNLPAQPKPL